VLAGKKKIKFLLHTILNSRAAQLSALVCTIPYDAVAPPYTLTELLRRARAGVPPRLAASCNRLHRNLTATLVIGDET
jgi:hypothetical protein